MEPSWFPLAAALFLLAASPASTLTSDGVLLLSFKYGIVSDPLSSLSSWNYSDDTPCNWRGISCAAINGTLRVVSVVLRECRLLGPIAADLGLVQHLQQLDLSYNSLNGALPSSIFSPELQRLCLAGNELSGAIPDFSAAAAASLVDLNLSDNALTGPIPRSLSSIPNLSVLSVSGNYLSGELPGGGFPRADFIDLSSNLFNGSIPTGFLSSEYVKLRYLNLSYNRVSGEIPAEFAAGLPPGAVVDLSFNNLSGEIPNSKALLNQNAVNFEGNSDLCGPPLKILCAAVPPESPPAFAAIPKGGGGTTAAAAQRSLTRTTIVAIIAADVAGIALLFLLFFYVYSLRKRRQREGRPFCCGKGRGDESDGASSCAEVPGEKAALPPEKKGQLVTVEGEEQLELETLLKASAYILGARGSSIMYKAVLADGTALAVRRIGESGGAAERFRDFDAQVRGIAKLRHPNLLGVRGFYWGEDEKLLIYDYLPNGSLANISYRKIGASPFHLPWENRLRIARGAAMALAFLHEKKCVHGNFKPSNILLRHDMEPVVADFAVDRLLAAGGAVTNSSFSARHFGSNRSTFSQSSLPEATAASPCLSCSGTADNSSSLSPYQAPESLKNLKPSAKWDVYSFGAVLLELLAGRVIAGGELGGDVTDGEGSAVVLRLVDPAIRGDVMGDEETFLACFKLAFSCTNISPHKRPAMKEAAQLLDRLLPLSPLQRHRREYS